MGFNYQTKIATSADQNNKNKAYTLLESVANELFVKVST